MKNFNFGMVKIMAGIAAVVLGLGATLPVEAQVHFGAQPRGNSVKIQGTSSTHDWEMTGTLIGGFLEFGPEVKLDDTGDNILGMVDGKVPVKGRAFIPITSIHSEAEHLPEVMERLMQKALNADQFKRIEYSVSELAFKGPHVSGKPFDFDATGELSIAGVTNKVRFPVSVQVLEEGKIKVTGTAPLKMTDYGVQPPAPSFGMGLMKCGDDIKIVFEWVLEARGH